MSARGWIARTVSNAVLPRAAGAWLLAVGGLSVGGCAEEGVPDAPGALEFSGPPGSGEPSLYASSDGRAILTWLEPAPAEEHALRVAVREAARWSEPRTVRRSASFFVNWADFPSLTEFGDGTWAIHWLEKVAASPYAYHVRMALSRDDGLGWSEPFTPHADRSPTEHGFVSMVPWGEGAALVWLDGREMPVDGHGESGGEEEGAMTLRFTTLSGDGALGKEVLLDERTCECCQTSLARTADGLLVAYRDRGPEEVRDIYVTRLEGESWSVPHPVARDEWRQNACPVNGPQLAAAGDRVVVAWFTGAGGEPRVYASFSEDGGMTFGEPLRVDAGRPIGRVESVLLEDGAALVAWLERAGGTAGLLVRRVGPAGGLSRPVRLGATSAARASGFPRLVRVGEELLAAWTVPGPAGGVRVRSFPLEAFEE